VIKVSPQRASFHSQYAVQSGSRDKHCKWPRLLECLIYVVRQEDPSYFDACDEGEFAVVDIATKEKAWFEMPKGAAPADITGMVESTFAAPALQVDLALWIV
jgi:hypothetical protein